MVEPVIGQTDLLKIPNWMEGLEKLFAEIEEHLGSDNEKVCTFKDLVEQIRQMSGDGIELQKRLLELVDGNEQLTNAVKEASACFEFEPKGVALVSELLELVKPHLDDTKFAELSRVTSLYVGKFVLFDFYRYFVELVLSDIDAIVKGKAMVLLTEVGETTISDVFKSGLYFTTLKASDDLKSSPGLRMLIFIGALLDEEHMQSAIKCMKLYSFGFISHESALSWIETYNPFITKQFIDFQNQEKSGFLPSRVFESVSNGMEENYIEWVFGKQLCPILKLLPKTAAKNALQLSNERTLQKNREYVQDPSHVGHYIADLQSTKFFKVLKSGARAIRTGQHILTAIPEGAVASVFGKQCELDKNDAFYRTFFKKVRDLGRTAFQNYIKYLSQKLASVSPSSPDGRTIYHTRMNRNVIIRELVFNGARFPAPSPKCLSVSFAVARRTIQRFAGLEENFATVVDAIQRGHLDCDSNSVLTIYYFMELVRVLGLLDEEHFKAVESIPDLVFSDVSPLKVFEGEPAANVDIVLRHLAKQLKKVNQLQSIDQGSLGFQGDFLFHVEIRDEMTISEGTMNTIGS